MGSLPVCSHLLEKKKICLNGFCTQKRFWRLQWRMALASTQAAQSLLWLAEKNQSINFPKRMPQRVKNRPQTSRQNKTEVTNAVEETGEWQKSFFSKSISVLFLFRTSGVKLKMIYLSFKKAIFIKWFAAFFRRAEDEQCTFGSDRKYVTLCSPHMWSRQRAGPMREELCAANTSAAADRLLHWSHPAPENNHHAPLLSWLHM